MWTETERTVFEYISYYPDPYEAWCMSKTDRRVRPDKMTYAEVDRNAEHALFIRHLIINISEYIPYTRYAVGAAAGVVTVLYSAFKGVRHLHRMLICEKDPSPPTIAELVAALRAVGYTTNQSNGWISEPNL